MKKVLFTLFILLTLCSQGYSAINLKADTGVTVTVGPFMSINDGLTGVTTLTLGSADHAELLKTAGAATVDISGRDFSTISSVSGWYHLGLTTSDTDTEGPITIVIQDADLTLPVFAEYQVVNANVYDSLHAAATTDYLQVDTIQVSGDATSADNLELQYDTTGLTGDTFPSTQLQLGQIALTGAAVNMTTESYALTTGTQSGNTYSATISLDGTNHEHTDDTGAMDLYYQFDIGGDGVPTSTTFTGYLNGNNDDLEVYAYNWGSTSWDQIGTLNGQVASTNITETYTLFTSHVGTGANIGKVRIRLTDGAFTLTTATLAIDQIYVSYAIVSRTVGYAGGAIWVDTVSGTAGTESYVNGTADNPVLTWADALTISSNLGIIIFHMTNGSSITLTGANTNYEFFGKDWTLALGGQSIANAFIQGARVSGIATGDSYILHDCHILSGTTIETGTLCHSAISGDLWVSDDGTLFIEDCYSAVAGTSTPSIDFGSAVTDSQANFRHYSGGIEIKNFGVAGTDNMSLEGDGQIVINANCTGGTVAIRGNFTVTDNASAAVTLSDNARFDIDQPWDSTFSELSAGAPSATPNAEQALMLQYMALRNQTETTATETRIFNDSGVSIAESDISDDGTTFTKGEYGATD